MKSLSLQRTQSINNSTEKCKREGQVLTSDGSKMKQAVQTERCGVREGLLTEGAFEETPLNNGNKPCPSLEKEHSRLWKQQRKPGD